MRLLIDGYNLMHALGLMGRRFGPDGLHRVRHRFLNDLAALLEPAQLASTTIVFDAASPPPGLPDQARHKGMTVVFAVDDDEADDRIEALISRDSARKGLIVVSSDRRVRRFAERRGARSVSSDEFWSDLESRMKRRPLPKPEPAPISSENEAWVRVFAEVDVQLDALAPTAAFLSDEELARIEREEGATLSPRRLKKPIA